jgi:hypothetical protein|tara:strand:+ start:151 stop:1068 length:918 start_codon:yes stop_codon:yes gene_type:complete
MNKDKKHVEMRNKVSSLLDTGMSIEEISDKLKLPLGTRFLKKSAKWYRYCIIAKKNQKKAIEKHPNLYSKAGKIAQQKHPWLGHELGKRYGSMAGKNRMEQLRKEGKISEYFSRAAKKLQKLNPDHSKNNMKKTHETMKKNGTFFEHQRKAAIKCMEKNPNQLKEMSTKAHRLYPLALLALESRRKNYPYEFMDCLFDSEDERKLCKIFVNHKLMIKPEEGKNIHFRINNYHIDFLIKDEVFVEYHPPMTYGTRKGETVKSYYEERREILDKNGYRKYPLVTIDRLNQIESKINKIKKLLTFERD